MSDFGDEEYKNMICVESGYIEKRRLLRSNEKFKMEQEILTEEAS
jgi:D-hexose-6-phosphate mutarotase